MALDIDRYSHVESSLQRWDPRVKIAAVGVYIFAVALLNSIPLAILAFGISISVLSLARLPFDFVKGGVQFVSIFYSHYFL